MKRVGAVIVTHNSAEHITACLSALSGRVDQIVVVDNASDDGTADLVAGAQRASLIANPENRGFAAALNQGIQALDTELILALNPDAIVLTSLAPLAEAFEDPSVGAAAGKLVDGSGRPQIGFNVRRFPTPASLALEALGMNRVWKKNPVNRRYRCLDLDPDRPAEVEQPAGAFLMIRRGVWQALGGWDCKFYPLWFEDVDFLKRLRSAGFRIIYEPQAVARHAGGHSVQHVDADSRILWWYGSLLRYAVKHFRPLGRFVVAVAVLCGSVVRMVFGLLFWWKRYPVKVYVRVIRFACLRLLPGRLGEVDGLPVRARH